MKNNTYSNILKKGSMHFNKSVAHVSLMMISSLGCQQVQISESQAPVSAADARTGQVVDASPLSEQNAKKIKLISDSVAPKDHQLSVDKADPSVSRVSLNQFNPDISNLDAITLDSPDHQINGTSSTTVQVTQFSDLADLETRLLGSNPMLMQKIREYEALVSKSEYANILPDPKISSSFFVSPIETMSGSIRNILNLNQTIPWIGRLNAAQKKAVIEAMATHSDYQNSILKLLTQLRVNYYRLYIIDRQIEVTEANRSLLESLIQLANARVSNGLASQGDVLSGSVELAKIEENLLRLNERRDVVSQEIMRLAVIEDTNRIETPRKLEFELPNHSPDGIISLAQQYHPEFEAARLRSEAAAWGVEIARLMQRPELNLGLNYYFTDANRPASTLVNIGEDPWAVNVGFSLPLWSSKYQSMKHQAIAQHDASHLAIADLELKYRAVIHQYFAEAQRASSTAELFQSSIIPQARQTLEADQNSYSNGVVEFDRVIQGYRNLLTLELGYQQASGELAIANALIAESAGVGFLVPTQSQDP